MKKKDLPLVSIAIITYNQKEYLKECIESILNQTYKNIEIIIADDASNDGTQEMLEEYKIRYPNKFILKLSKTNQGITNNSNLAHFACTGKYIAWMGGDDLMFDEKIEKQVKYMEENTNCSICYHNLEVFQSETKKTLYYFNEKNKYEGDVRTIIRNGTFNGACSTMVRRVKTPLKGFNESIPIASDWLYWVETLHNGGTINYIDEVLGKYRRHKNNITKKEVQITQNEVDHLNSCNIILSLNPDYFEDVIYRYSNNLLSIRNKIPFFKTTLIGFILNPSLKNLIRIFIYLVSFGKVKK